MQISKNSTEQIPVDLFNNRLSLMSGSVLKVDGNQGNFKAVLTAPEPDRLTISSVIQKEEQTKGKITITYRDVSANPDYVYYDSYFSVNGLTDISAEDKKKINESIKRALTFDEQVSGRTNTSQQQALHDAQLKAKLDFVADHLVPEQYRTQMKEANAQFIQEKTVRFNRMLERTYQSVYEWALTQPGPTKASFAEPSLQKIKELKNGDSQLQSEQAYYMGDYSRLNEGDSNQFGENYMRIMQHYQTSEQQKQGQYWTPYHANNVAQYIDSMVNDWNAFINRLDGDFRSYLVPSADHPLIDTQV